MSPQRPVEPSGETARKSISDCKNDRAILVTLAQMRRDYCEWWDAGGSGGAEEDHVEDFGKDRVRAQLDPDVEGKAATSWLKGQTEAGIFGSREASVFCHNTVYHLREGDSNLLAVLLDNACARYSRQVRVCPTEEMGPDIFQKFFVSCGGLRFPVPFPERRAVYPAPEEIWSLYPRTALSPQRRRLPAHSTVTQLLKMKSSGSLQFSLSQGKRCRGCLWPGTPDASSVTTA